jgi:hypothetical protein
MRSAHHASLIGGFQTRFLSILTIAGIFAWCGAPAIASTNASINYIGTPPATCPQTINFSGQINTSDFSTFQARTVQYQWLFDDMTGPQQYLTFPTGTSSEMVYMPRTFASSHSGWVSLMVWQPGSYRTQNVPIQIACSVAPQPSPENCVNYNSSNLTDVNKNAAWYVVDGTTSLQQFGSEADALAGLAVARAHHQQCFIGMGKALQYLMEYWK